MFKKGTKMYFWRKAVILGLCMAILSGCNRQEEESNVPGSDYVQVQEEVQELSTPSEQDESWQRLSMFFYRDEIVQIWAKKEIEEVTVNDKVRQETKSIDVYLYHEGGESELLLENAPKSYLTKWFLDQEGNRYVLSKGIIRLDETGNELYHCQDEYVRDICQLKDGRILVLVGDGKVLALAELQTDTGKVIRNERVDFTDVTGSYIAAGENGLLVLDSEGVWEVDEGTGGRFCALSFEDTAYQLPWTLEDFCVGEGGNLQILAEGELKNLQLVDIRQTRTIIRLANTAVDDAMEDWVERFNKENKQYYVVIEECEYIEGDESESEFIDRINVEIGTGGGPDIICGGVLSDERSLIEKGGLVDLTPFMEQSGVNVEDYFPAVFDHWREEEEIYGAIAWLTPQGYAINQEMFSGNKMPDNRDELVNAMLEYPQKAMFAQYMKGETILRNLFLDYSESICQTVDWETGKCDFGGELFTKILEVAKRYAYDEKNELPYIAESRTEWSLYIRDSRESLEKEGKLDFWNFFDEGNLAAINPYAIMGINGNSSNKEGAWAFICYVLSSEVQLDRARLPYHGTLLPGYPASKIVFEKIATEELEEGSIGKTKNKNGVVNPWYKAGQQEFMELGRDEDAYRAMYDLTKEDVAEVREMLEQAQTKPVHNQPIIDIICEEAGAYFSGSKTVDEVCGIIQNRVQLYLDENR